MYFGIKSSENIFICGEDETVTLNDQDAVSFALSVLIKLEILQEETVPMETARDWNTLWLADLFFFFFFGRCCWGLHASRLHRAYAAVALSQSWCAHGGICWWQRVCFGPSPVEIFISLNASRANWLTDTAVRPWAASTVHMIRARDPHTRRVTRN